MKNMVWIAALSALSLLFGITLWAAPPNGYELTWSDEFDGVSMDTSKWDYRILGVRRDAVQVEDAISVTNGALTITTYTENGTHYTGMIGTQGKFEQAFGYWEARIQLFDSPGMWSAYWVQSPTVGNPIGDTVKAGTEIDIFEHRVMNQWGGNIEDTLDHALHWDGYGAYHKTASKIVSVPGLTGTWHTYACLWTDQGYTFYVDGNQTWTTQQAISKRPEYNILSTEVWNGSWAGSIPAGGYGDRASSTTKMNVDYVRVYALPLILSIEAASISETAGLTTATVTRPYATGSSLTVTLSSNDPSEISVPNEVVIPANQRSAVFTVSAVDDAIADGTQHVIITASSADYSPGIDSIDVIANDEPRLILVIDETSISEDGGTSSATVTRVHGDTSDDLAVTFLRDDLSTVAELSPVTILSNQTSAIFTVTAVNDNEFNGDQTVTITAQATGLSDGMDTIDVMDDDSVVVTYAYNLNDRLAANEVLSTDGWTGSTIAAWLANPYTGDILYARNTANADNTITRANNADFSYVIGARDTEVSLEVVARSGGDISFWQTALIDASGSAIIGFGASFSDGGNELFILDGGTRHSGGYNSAGLNATHTLRLDLDLVAGTGSLFLDDTAIITDQALSNLGNITDAAGLYVRSDAMYVGPASWEITTVPEALEVVLTEPIDGSTFVSGPAVELAADAAHAVSVEFYVDGSLVKTDGQPPYTAVWFDAAPGSHNLSAMATYPLGVVATTSVAVITVDSGNGNLVDNPGFEDGTTNWVTHGGHAIGATTAPVYEGSAAGWAYNRDNFDNGLAQMLTGELVDGQTYVFSCEARLSGSNDSCAISVQTSYSTGDPTYQDVASAQISTASWTRIQGEYTFSPDPARTVTEIRFYIAGAQEPIEIFVDDVFVAETTLATVDRDMDGMPDQWEENHFGGINVANGGAFEDRDGDGMDNRSELRSGTDPTLPESRLVIDSLQPAAGQLDIYWQSVSGKSYSIMMATNLVEGFWTTVAEGILATGTETAASLETETPALFIKVELDE
jgi:beta-glucanase (GH16 family)